MLSKEEKISLFISLFKGRTDVYAKRWENWEQTKSGYFPVFVDQTKQSYASLTEEVVEAHLRGQLTIGIYPLLTDNKSHFIVADFDKEHWQSSIILFLETCKKYDLPVSVERSRSGNGGHVWCFFENSYPAVRSRKIFLHLIKQCGLIDKFDKKESFDRLLPSQDYLSGKGLGNLIALPLQGNSRKEANTIFLDADNNMIPFEDQWSYLQSIERISSKKLDELFENIIEEDKKGMKVFQYQGDKLPIFIGEFISLPKDKIFMELANFLAENLNFFNNEYSVKQRMGLSTYNTERYFKLLDKEGDYIKIPRGFLSQLIHYLDEQKVPYDLQDQRYIFDSVKFHLTCELFDYQEKCLDEMLKGDEGILVAPPGSGKTIMGLALASQRAQPTLIITHRKQIYNQWLERIESFLQIQKKNIGQIAGTKKEVKLPITVAMIQSLHRLKNIDEITKQFGCVIVDECHHIPAKMFREVIIRFNPKYLYGLTATPQRKHNDEKLIFVYLGGILHQVQQTQKTDISAEKKVTIFPEDKSQIQIYIRDTDFTLPFKISTRNYQLLTKIISFDSHRNNFIIQDIKEKAKRGEKCLVLTERKGHVEMLSWFLKQDFEVITLTGDISTVKRKEKEKQIHSWHYQIILATGQLVGEGVHFPNIDSLFLVFPFSFEGKLTQYIGRILHSSSTQKSVYDYRDQNIDYLERMFKKRKKFYDKYYLQNTHLETPHKKL